MNRVRTATVALTLCFVTAACGGGSFSATPSAYIPKKIDGNVVDTNNTIGKSFAGVISKSAQVLGVASGIVKPQSSDGGKIIPFQLIILAARGKDQQAVTKAHDALFGQLGILKVKTDKRSIDGVDVELRPFNEAGLKGSTAFASPGSNVMLIVFSFNGQQAAVDAVTAMLHQGKS